MNGYLLDSTTLLWAGGHTNRLSAATVAALRQGPAWLSVMSYWEVAIKNAVGRLDVGPVEAWWRESAARLSARILPLREDHVSAIARLPLLHRDPFDRALVAQAMVEDLTLLSPDREIARYISAGLKLLR